MTKNIRKNAPIGTEYFEIIGNHVNYYKCDEDDRVFIWDEHRWLMIRFMNRGDLHADLNIHILNDDVFERKLWVLACIGFLSLYWYCLR